MTGILITASVVVIVWLISYVLFMSKEIKEIKDVLKIYISPFSGRKTSRLDTLLREEEFILYERLNQERFAKLEEYLGIKRVQKEEKIDKYVETKNK